ncbi:GHKL domain-containing protein [Anaerocolumna aminovalerica]|uniref:sensor histidine kinase n=1 Tax=Anaerocolumna aminovalerica TaxID=1527 RepID=UPI001C0ED8CF|nr:GHKL domain-containing protein [Anaerocolumna aminovalerica]MBU5334795.1 GHKL domain-containing protein [Anaerocolumna aminovalerica]
MRTLQKKLLYPITLKEGKVILLIFFITLLIGLSVLEIHIVSGSYDSIYLNITVIGLIIINLLSFYFLYFISKNNERKLKYTLLLKQLENQKNEIIEVKNQYNEMLKIRHDFKNYILCGLALLKEKNISEAEAYFSNILEEKLTFDRSFVFTSNNTINAIINAKINKCNKLGINTYWEVVDRIEFDDIDLSILFANLFDNAIEACALNNKKSEIILIVTYEKAYLNIIMKNTIEKSILSYNPNLITTKKDKTMHGFGLKTIYDIVNKYDGIIKYYEKNNYFYVDVWLKMLFMPE